MPRALRPLLLALSLCLLPLGGSLQAAPSDDPTAPTSAESRSPLAERSAAAAAALAEYLPAQEQQQLQAGEESFLALWLPANTPQAHGVVILLGGAGETPDWPASLGPLRRKLPDAGWHSLALGLPDPVDNLPPARPADRPDPVAQTPAVDEPVTASPSSPVAAASANIGTTDQPAQPPAARQARRIEQRIEAALALARRQQAKRIVLLGHGSGAYWAARYLSEKQPADVQNLLMVAAEQPAGTSPTLDALVPGLKLATGDFYYRDRPAARLAARSRAQASKRQALAAYIQVAMQSLPGNPALEHEQLFRRLHGWLSLQLKAR